MLTQLLGVVMTIGCDTTLSQRRGPLGLRLMKKMLPTVHDASCSSYVRVILTKRIYLLANVINLRHVSAI